MDAISDWEKAFILRQRVAHLATVDTNGQPHAVPIVYAFDGQQIYTPIDEKPKKVGAYKLKRVRNIQENRQVAVIIDKYSEDWEQLAWVQVRGRAEITPGGNTYSAGVELLTAKYPQYAEMPLQGRPVIIITPQEVISWRAQED